MICILDAIEEEYNINQRNKVIVNANKVAFENQEKVKKFKSKLLMCDVHDEMRQQKALKKKRQDRDKQVEQQWLDLEKQVRIPSLISPL